MSKAARSTNTSGTKSHDEISPCNDTRKSVPRKGHTKSRKGCYSCKTRKVKCTEDLPQCLPCRRNDLVCEYPDTRYRSPAHPAGSTTSTEKGAVSVLAPLRGQPATTFSSDDMRFLSHFILSAYPKMPFNSNQAWMDAAQMSHEYECLMHSILGLAASHLTLSSSSDYSFQALSHRVRAIRSLNRLLSQPGHKFTTADADAAFGALLALVFQSTYLPECMLDFVAMVRGCQLVSTQIIPDVSKSVFRAFHPEVHNAIIFEQPRASTPHEGTGISALDSSLRALGPLCKSVIELSLLADVRKALQLYIDEPIQAYAYLPSIFAHFGRMGDQDFALFCNPDNRLTQILLAHFFLINYIIDHSTSFVATEPLYIRKHIILLWIERVAAELPPECSPFLSNALEVARGSI